MKSLIKKILLPISLIVLVAPLLSCYKASADDVCTVSPILVNSCRPWLGGVSSQYPQVPSDTKSQDLYLEQRMGRQLDMVRTYYAIGANSLTANDVYFATRPNTILDVNWKPTPTWGAIASQNAGIDQMAASIKALGSSKIILTLWHEPENDVSPGGDPNCPNVDYKGTAGTVAQYVNMWAYVENRFAADGVTNVVWAMDYMNYSPWLCLVNDLYPGDNLVNWILFNGYATGTNPTFDNMVGTFYNYLTANSNAQHDYLSKPWGIAEWGTTGYGAAAEEQYYNEGQIALDDNTFPNLKSYGVYDAQNPVDERQYRVAYDDNGTFDPVKAAAYYSFADDPRFTDAFYNAAPSTPTGLTATAVSGSQVNLSWTASTDNVGVTGYNVFRNGNLVATVTNGTTYSDSGLTDATTYQYTVSAYDAAGNTSPQTSSVSATTLDTSAPSTPTGLTATAVSGSQVNLSWTASTDNVGVTGYNVFRNGNLVATVTNGTTYSDSGLTDATTYQYTVSAYDAAGNTSPQTSSVSATTLDTSAPSTPTGLTATAVSGSQVNLSWTASTDNVGVTGYNVFRNGNLVATVTNGTTYSDSGLTDATTYQYTVSAYDAAGNTSPQTSSVSATTLDTSAPSTPTGLTATAVSGSQVNLSWTASTDNVGVTGYNVFRNGNLVATVTNGTTYSDSGLTDATTYQYTVSAYDAAGNTSPQTSSVSATTLDTSAPSTPTGLTATAVSGSQVNLSWTASTDNVGVTGYNVFRNGNLVATVTNGTTYSDSGLTDATTYQYTVSAYDAAGNTSPQTSSVSATTLDTSAPSTPTGLTATAVSGSQVNLSWTASTDNVGVTGYNVFRNGNLVATVTNGTTYSDSGLTDATTYQYTVSAYDAAGNTSPQTSSVSATTLDTSAPSTPTGLSSTLTSKAINLTWKASTDNVGVAGYNIYRNDVLLAKSTTTSYVDSAVKQGTTYTYAIAAYDAAGNLSIKSSTLSVLFPDTIPPTKPTNLILTPATTTIALKWTASTDNVGVAGYKIYKDSKLLVTTKGTGTTYTNTGLTARTFYSYYVRAYDAAGNLSAASSTVSAKTL